MFIRVRVGLVDETDVEDEAVEQDSSKARVYMSGDMGEEHEGEGCIQVLKFDDYALQVEDI